MNWLRSQLAATRDYFDLRVRHITVPPVLVLILAGFALAVVAFLFQ